MSKRGSITSFCSLLELLLSSSSLEIGWKRRRVNVTMSPSFGLRVNVGAAIVYVVHDASSAYALASADDDVRNGNVLMLARSTLCNRLLLLPTLLGDHALVQRER